MLHLLMLCYFKIAFYVSFVYVFSCDESWMMFFALRCFGVRWVFMSPISGYRGNCHVVGDGPGCDNFIGIRAFGLIFIVLGLNHVYHFCMHLVDPF